jgi:hypothetical protein
MQMPLCRAIIVAAVAGLFVVPTSAGAQTLDFEVYKATVEPVFTVKREGYTRCVVCHGGAANAFRLERLTAGRDTFTDEQSRKNFEVATRLVIPGKPNESHLLIYPLVPEEGGAAYHSGGRQWPSKSDPNWQAIARWINGQK